MAKDKNVVANEALDLLDGVCARVACDRQNHYNIQMAVQVIRAELNKEDEVTPKKEGENEEGEK